MQELILIIAEIINSIHDIIMDMSSGAGLNLTDKDLHLWVFGIIGITTFGFVHVVFKFLSKYSITSISFVYTFTVLVVLVFAIEIQQKITGRGQMEFDDAVIGLWGFLLFFAAFLLLKGIFKLIVYLFNRNKSKTNDF
ncbi:hypothetical protein JMM81_14895 [Bacillus sp. V3B]|uniref:hypothetical protein n=1 Tax=Bacillus sp. V3B TaxID=2804915 RepID=UPI002109B292|nr:hypothetical protein [Bacillus sp. V3B]MCQ6276213.1 hypothetical protein [Bacillus sp. V3B]